MQSNDLSEIAQSGVHQIVEDHKAGQRETNRHINRATWVFVIFAMLFMSASIYIQQRIEQRINEPAPPVVSLAVSMPVENPTLCPGDTLDYSLTITINEPSVTEIDTIVRNLDTGRTEWYGQTTRNIYEAAGQLTTETQWTIPLLLPATLTRPERQWAAGSYKRNIAVTGIEGEKRASVVSVPFMLASDCPNVGG